MKTKEQILEHLKTNGYEDFATAKILGYLLGANIVEKGEEVIFLPGRNVFEDFFKWLNEEPKKNKFSDIGANLDYFLGFTDGKISTNVKKKTMENIQFLMKNKEYLQFCIDNFELYSQLGEQIKRLIHERDLEKVSVSKDDVKVIAHRNGQVLVELSC